MTKVLFDENHKIIGTSIVGTNAGELIAESTLAIEMGCDAEDIALTVHPHPTLSESLMMATEVFEGTATDLPPQRKRRSNSCYLILKIYLFISSIFYTTYTQMSILLLFMSLSKIYLLLVIFIPQFLFANC